MTSVRAASFFDMMSTAGRPKNPERRATATEAMEIRRQPV